MLAVFLAFFYLFIFSGTSENVVKVLLHPRLGNIPKVVPTSFCFQVVVLQRRVNGKLKALAINNVKVLSWLSLCSFLSLKECLTGYLCLWAFVHTLQEGHFAHFYQVLQSALTPGSRKKKNPAWAMSQTINLLCSKLSWFYMGFKQPSHLEEVSILSATDTTSYSSG